jgi:hypothetical protein
MNKNSLRFKEIDIQEEQQAHYSDGCSGSRSDCCTRVCTRDVQASNDNLQAWDEYLEINAGVLQY